MRTLALFLFVTLVLACDSSDDYEDCRYSETFSEPKRARCPGSVFPKEEPRSREIYGTVFRGEEPLPNVTVRMEPRTNDANAAVYTPLTAVSDVAGFYRVRNVPFEYDLTARLDDEVLVYRRLSHRYFEPTFGVTGLPRTWMSELAVVVQPPPKPGHVVTFVGSGDDVIFVSGDSTKGAAVATKAYQGVATIHAIEHPEGTLIDRATAYGNVVVNVQAGRHATAEVKLTAIERFDEIGFTTPLPEGFTLDGDIELFIDFGPRTNQAPFAVLAPNVMVKLPIFDAPNGVYAKASAHRGTAVSTTALYPLPARQGIVELPFPEPPKPETAVSGSDYVAALGKGVVEHVLRPAIGGSGPTIHLITEEREGKLPDLEALGFPKPTGRWVWTARDFPKVERVDRFYHVEWLIQPNATTEPTEIFLP